MHWAGGRVHYLARNHSTWTPAACIFLDSETRTEGFGDRETEVLRCWDAKLVRRRHRRKAGEYERDTGTTRLEAAAAIDEWASSDKSTWLYAHNVAFDLVSCGLAEHLSALGWELSSRHAVSGSSPWLVLHKGRQDVTVKAGHGQAAERKHRVKWQHTLTIADSFSLMPVPLAVLGQYAPMSKPPLPGDDATPAQWQERCRADVDILAWSVLTLMDWWEDNDLGQWSVSGAAAGWNSYRHQIGPKDVVIDPDRDAVGLEHKAVYGGRRDIFRCGSLPPGRYAELDFEGAYPSIAATQLLPRKRVGKLTPLIAKAIIAGKANYGIVAECLIDTDVPRWPLRVRERVFYPVGTFRTTLAGPDLMAAQAAGALREVGAGYFYSMSDHMQEWAKWCLSVSRGELEGVPGPVQIFAKGAGRSVCGKWAQRGWETTEFPGPPGNGWSFEDCFISGSDASATICGLAGKHYLSIADQESDHEFPAVLAYIEAHCRTRLASLIAHAPEGAIIQCDTDGVMASLNMLAPERTGGFADMLPPATEKDYVAAWLNLWNDICTPLVIREKRVFARAIVHGPQHVVLDGRPRFSGVPSSAWQSGDSRWMARLWPGLSWQIRHGDAAGYVRPVQEYLVTGPYAAGWVLTDGRVRPCEAALGDGGQADIVPWAETRWALSGDQLGPTQSSWARGLCHASTGDNTAAGQSEGGARQAGGDNDNAAQASA